VLNFCPSIKQLDLFTFFAGLEKRNLTGLNFVKGKEKRHFSWREFGNITSV